MELIAEHQIVGDGLGYAVIRNLYQGASGRVSVALTSTFSAEATRGLTIDQIMRLYPLQEDK